MPALRIAEHLNVIKDIAPGLFSCPVGFSADTLALEQLEEAFNDCVIVTVSTSTHTLLQVVSLEEVLPVIAAKLTALVGVHHDGLFGLAAPDSHQQRI